MPEAFLYLSVFQRSYCLVVSGMHHCICETKVGSEKVNSLCIWMRKDRVSQKGFVFLRKVFSVLETYSCRWSDDILTFSSSAEDSLPALSSRAQQHNNLPQKKTLWEMLNSVNFACYSRWKQNALFLPGITLLRLQIIENYILPKQASSL